MPVFRRRQVIVPFMMFTYPSLLIFAFWRVVNAIVFTFRIFIVLRLKWYSPLAVFRRPGQDSPSSPFSSNPGGVLLNFSLLGEVPLFSLRSLSTHPSEAHGSVPQFFPFFFQLKNSVGVQQAFLSFIFPTEGSSRETRAEPPVQTRHLFRISFFFAFFPRAAVRP